MNCEFTTQSPDDRVGIRQFTFPQCDDSEVHCEKGANSASVARAIGLELRFPESTISSGNGCANAAPMGMPVTTMHENRPPAASIREIW